MTYDDIMNHAKSLVVDRGKAYGSMEHNVDVAAQIASLKLNLAITPYVVLTIMESVKDARLAHDPTHADSHVDGVNYRAMRAMFAPKSEPVIKTTAPLARQPVMQSVSIDALEEGIANIAANFSPKK